MKKQGLFNSLWHLLGNWEYLRSIPKTIFFNFRFFPLKTALQFPVFISHRVLLKDLSGTVVLNRIETGIVKVGFGDIPLFDSRNAKSVLVLSGKIIFEGSAMIGPGCRLGAAGELKIGDGFAVTAFSTISAKKMISFGRNVLVSWDVSVIDHDWHDICDEQGAVLNPARPVVIGNDVWLGCRVLILKGSEIQDGVIVAAGTTLSGRIKVTNAIIGGDTNIRVIKDRVFWKR